MNSKSHLRPHLLLTCTLVFVGLLLPVLGLAADPPKRHFDLPADSAERSLKRLSEQSGRELLFPAAVVEGVRTKPVRGEMTALQALNAMLDGTTLIGIQDDRNGSLTVRRSRPSEGREKKALGRTLTAPRHGIIEGRVSDARSGDYLEGVRVTISGTSLEAFTNTEGFYRLQRVPAGPVRLEAFFTGTEARGMDFVLSPDSTAVWNLTLQPRHAFRSDETEAVVLSTFTVAAARELSGAAHAVNEQRFASNIRNVLSTDEFGAVPEGNVADFLKYMPGVTIESSGGNSRWVSINGVPPDHVPVTIDGFNLATTGNGGGTRRAVDLDMISINNASRIEVSFSPTPESPGGALAGSVNLVPRSAFERSRASFEGNAYLLLRDNARNAGRVPSTRDGDTSRNIHPGFDFSLIVPVNERFGYTLSAGSSTQYSAQDTLQNTWRGVSAPTNGSTYPHTTPDNPYLTNFFFRDEPKTTTRRSLGATVEYKLTPNDRLALSLQYSSFHAEFLGNQVQFEVGRVAPGDFAPTTTRGAAGFGSLTLTGGPSERRNENYMPTMVWRHTGPTIKWELGAGFSRAFDEENTDRNKGFSGFTARRNGVSVSFDDIYYLRPGSIAVSDPIVGDRIDPFDLASYALTGASQGGRWTAEMQRSLYGNLQHSFTARIPFTLKAGFDLRQAIRDLRRESIAYAYLGPDGQGSTSPLGGDDRAEPFLDPVFSQRVAPFGFPKVDAISNRLLWDAYQKSPAHFQVDENARYRAAASDSKHAEETIAAIYLRGDLAFVNRRLKLVGGVRAEQTTIRAQGPLSDATLNYQRDSAGSVIIGSNGRPLPIATDPLAVSRLTLLERAASVRKEYLRFFPSLNLSYTFHDQLIARVAYYRTLGRPNFDQYSGGLTLPDLELGPTPSNRIQVNNAGIKPWQAETINARLEYYFTEVGQVSIGAFQRDFDGLFGGTEIAATPEFLALYALDPNTYGNYGVLTQHNIAEPVRMTGVSLDYKQSLTFLPRWARGVQIFANGSVQRATGASLGAFTGSNYVPRSASWGVSLSRRKYSVRANWNYRDRHKRGSASMGTGIEAGTFMWGTKRLYLDLQGEYVVTRHFSIFANLRNLGNAYDDFEVSGPSTPEHAQFRIRRDYGSLWSVGMKGRF
ncbi:MAG: TonB-dependent receptor [Opitutaceae bacterium]|nr:TonB-dependent receptor [Opitutaceae bacterium]